MIHFFTGWEGCSSHAEVRGITDMFSVVVLGSLNYSATGGFLGSKCAAASGGTYGHTVIWGKNVPAQKTFTVGFHKLYTNNSSTRFFLNFVGPSITIYTSSTGFIVSQGSTLIAENIGNEDCASTVWEFYEVKLYSHATEGTIEIRKNEKVLGVITNLNTGGQDITQIRFGTGNSSISRWDNVYIADDFLGEIYAKVLYPAADHSVQFVPNIGTDNYALLNSYDDDTTIVESSVIGEKDTYTYDVLENSIPLAVFIGTFARKDGVGIRGITPIGLYDSVEYDADTEVTLNSTYPNSHTNNTIHAVFEKALDGTDWTLNKLNNTKWGFKLTS